MSKTVHSIKLYPYDSVNLAKLAYDRGDIVYDVTNQTIRLMDGVTVGGYPIATQTYTNTAISTALQSYTTTAGLNSTLANYVLTTALNTTLQSYVTNSSLSTSLASYTTTTGMNTAISGAISTEVTNRNTAISTAISTEVSNRNSAISTALTSYLPTANATIAITGTSGSAVSFNTGGGTLKFASNNGMTVGVSGTTITISSPQDLRTTATPTFTNLKIGNTSIRSLALALAAAMS
jgi:hypothetical protein